jgi:hypothetical protein
MAVKEVGDQFYEPGQMGKVEEAVKNDVLHRLKIVAVEELKSVAGYVEQFGKGESACLAVAVHRHWAVAMDETKDRRLSREITSNGIKLINTEAALEPNPATPQQNTSWPRQRSLQISIRNNRSQFVGIHQQCSRDSSLP